MVEWNGIFRLFRFSGMRVHSKRIPKFSKTFPGIFTVSFSFGPEISVFLVEWKAPLVGNLVPRAHVPFGQHQESTAVK